jgi:GAF domain-containing protein/HAMP domain-containing protein
MSEQFKQRALVMKRIILIGLVVAVVGIAADVIDYYNTQAWYVLVDAAFIFLALACLVLAWRAMRKHKPDLAAYWMLLAVFLGVGIDELLWTQDPILTALVAALLLLLGALLLPGRWRVWGAAAAGYLIFVVLVNWLEPLPRQNLAESGGQFVAYFAVVGLLVIFVLWQYADVRERTQSIRARLLITYVPLALLLASVIGGSAFFVSRNQIRRQVENQLTSVATLKEAEIQTWLDDLLINLDVVATSSNLSDQLTAIMTSASADTSTYDSVLARLQWSIDQMGLFEEMFVMDLQGQVVLSTDEAQEGKVYARDTFFQEGRQQPYVHPPSYSTSLEAVSVLAARPLLNQDGEIIAVLAGRADMDALSEIMLERSGLGETGETYLVGSNYALLTKSRFEDAQIPYVRSDGTNMAIEQRTNGAGLYTNYRGAEVVGAYHWLPDFQVALLAEQETEEAFRGVSRLLLVDAGVGVGAVVLVVIVSIILTNTITTPLARLADTAQQIAAGDRELSTVEAERKDEIGALARAFNSMTLQLREFIDTLEDRVAERTQELEQRSAYLETSAEVSRAVTSILERDRLIQDTVDLIQERFGLYYVGLFLVEGDWAVLRAGTGEAGQEMLAEEHRLRIAGESMIGRCIQETEARIALDVGDEAVRFDNPHLPHTRSEGALPLRSRGQVIGALSIQSTVPNAFDRDTVTLLQTMADQVAVALDNARLFAETQASLEAERRAYGELSREAWREILKSRSEWGYDYLNASIMPAREDWTPAMQRAARNGQSVQDWTDGGSDVATLAVPLRVRGRVVGVLSFGKDEPGQSWTAEEQTLLETLVEELGLALESARLYEDTQRRAAREHLISEVTSQMRETLEMETVLNTAVREIGEALGLAALDVRLDVREQ